jgi:hypothetical protein
MPTPEELCAVSVTADAARADKAASAAGVCYDRAIVAKSRADANTHLVKLDDHCMKAYNASVTALRTAARAAEVSIRGNTHICSAAADAARASECASRAATLSTAAFTECIRKWGTHAEKH